MFKLSKCCFIFPLRPGCVAIAAVFTIISLLSAINKVIEIYLFTSSLHARQTIEGYDDTRLVHSMQAGIIGFSFGLLLDLSICSSALAFIYGIVKDRLRLLPPFVFHFALRVGYFGVYYFDMGTRRIENNNSDGGLRLYLFGLIICGTYAYLWLCTYSALLELKAEKDIRRVIRDGILQRQTVEL